MRILNIFRLKHYKQSRENSGLIGLNHLDTINNNFPENFLEEFKKLVEKNLANEKVIEELKDRLNVK